MVAVNVVVVLAISASAVVKSLAVEDCHLVTLPVLPLNVRVVLLVPVHTVAPPAMVPPTEDELTVTSTAVRVDEGHEVPLPDHVIST